MTKKDKKPDVEPESREEESAQISDRRRLLKGLAAGSAAITGQRVLPTEWSKPLVDAVIIPAHAQLSPSDTNDKMEVIEKPIGGDRGAMADDFPDTADGGDPANDSDNNDSDMDRDGDQDEMAGDGTDVGDGSQGDGNDNT